MDCKNLFQCSFNKNKDQKLHFDSIEMQHFLIWTHMNILAIYFVFEENDIYAVIKEKKESFLLNDKKKKA